MAYYNTKKKAKEVLLKHLEDDYSDKPQKKLQELNQAIAAYQNFLNKQKNNKKNNLLLEAARNKYNRELSQHQQSETENSLNQQNVNPSSLEESVNQRPRNTQLNIQLADSKDDEYDLEAKSVYQINTSLNAEQIDQVINQTVNDMNEQFKQETGSDQNLFACQKIDDNTWRVTINSELIDQNKHKLASDSKFNQAPSDLPHNAFVPELESNLKQKDPNATIEPSQPGETPRP